MAYETPINEKISVLLRDDDVILLTEIAARCHRSETTLTYRRLQGFRDVDELISARQGSSDAAAAR